MMLRMIMTKILQKIVCTTKISQLSHTHNLLPKDIFTAITRIERNMCDSSSTPVTEGSQSSSSYNGGSNGAVDVNSNNKTHSVISKRYSPKRQDGGNGRATISLGSRLKRSLRRKSQSINDDAPYASSRSSIKKHSNYSSSSNASVQSRSHDDVAALVPTSTPSSIEELAMLLLEMGDDDEFKKTLGIGGGISDQEQQHRLSCTSTSSAQSPSHPAASATVQHRRPSQRFSASMVSSLGSLSDQDEEGEFYSSGFTNDNDNNSDLDQQTGAPTLDSKSMLAKLGPSPTSIDLANIAAVRAGEYINECLFKSEESSGTLDREKWESIPQYTKSDLHVRKHLGMGSFSDAFEVTVMVAIQDDTTGVKKFMDSSGTDDLDRRLEAKFKGVSFKNETKPAKDDETLKMEKEGDYLDKEIEAIFGPQVTTMEPKESFQPAAIQHNPTRRLRSRRQSVDSGAVHNLTSSMPIASNMTTFTRSIKKKKMTYAMKCLRPQIRSDTEQFIVGVEDLVHETAMLASLDHPNIIKLHGRAGCGVGGAAGFRLSDGYFILLDILQDTLVDRIDRWKTMSKAGGGSVSPSLSQIKTAHAISDAMSYLHSKNIILRDLKPANVGYDSRGVLKMFDFGFAFGLTTNEKCGSSSSQPHCLLYDTCGTPRYMAPEVAFGTGYALPADVHSFGILLWEICSLKKPFAKIRSHDEFYKSVYEQGGRPKMIKYWAPVLRDTMKSCWSACSEERPTMEVVKNLLGDHVREMTTMKQHQGFDISRQSSVCRRLTG